MLKAQDPRILELEKRQPLFNNKALILNEALVSYILNSDAKQLKRIALNYREEDRKWYYICRYSKLQGQEIFLLLQVDKDGERFITWNKDLNNWYNVADFFRYPHYILPNRCGVIDQEGNYGTFDLWMQPSFSSRSSSNSHQKNDFSLAKHEEDYQDSNNFYFILNQFSGVFQSNKLKPLEVLSCGYFPLGFLYRGQVELGELAYINHTVDGDIYTVLCLSTQKLEDCITFYSYYLLVTNGNDLNQTIRLGSVSYIGNILSYFDLDLNLVIENRLPEWWK